METVLISEMDAIKKVQLNETFITKLQNHKCLRNLKATCSQGFTSVILGFLICLVFFVFEIIEITFYAALSFSLIALPVEREIKEFK